MNAFDKIIGYSVVKKELEQISDTLKNSEVYEKLGVSAPRGLLLYGEPGVGKSLMAGAVIEESGRKAYVCRKDKPNGAFVKEIKAVFDAAAQNTPSIVYLDDMDKFANGDERHRDAEEYVTVQSCIDSVKGKNVFVLATANSISCLPRSLYRAGRFDRRIRINAPRGEDAQKIITHYLNGKKLVKGVDPKVVARILDGSSCAELETVINQAGLYAGYNRADHIGMDDIIEACMQIRYNTPLNDIEDEEDDFNDLLSDPNSDLTQIVYHEAGHAVVSEILCPESVTLISVRPDLDGTTNGFTAYYKEDNYQSIYWKKSRIICGLAGRAAVDQKFGVYDSGSGSDIEKVYAQVERFVTEECINGLNMYSSWNSSENQKISNEQIIKDEMNKYYMKARELLIKNMDFLEKTAAALAEKKMLSALDLKRIKEECKIVMVEI